MPDKTEDVLRRLGVTLGGSPSTPIPVTSGLDGDNVDKTLRGIGVELGKAGEPRRKPAPIVPPEGTRPRLAPEAEAEAQRIAKSMTHLTPIAEGVPIVGTLPRHITAAIAAEGQPRTGMGMPGESFGRRFGANEAVLARASELYGEDNPLWNVVGNVLGGVAAGIPMGAGLGGIAMGTRGPTLGARFVGGGVGGAGIGAADAALRGEDVGYGGMIGGVGGTLAPLISSGARSAARAVSEGVLPRGGPFAGVMRRNIDRLTDALEGETPQSIAEARRRIGPAGMLVDINPRTLELGVGVGNTPGIQGKGVMQEAMRERGRTQSARMIDLLDRTIAPRTDIEAFKKFTAEARAAAADPLYAQWRSTQIQPTDKLKELIPRLSKAGAFDLAEELSGITGEPVTKAFFTSGQNKQFPTAQSWDYAKQGLDRAIDKAYNAGDKTLARALSGLRRDLLTEIEATPQGGIWKQARQEWASRSAILDQIERGRDTFLGGRSGMSVDELKDELRHVKGPELQARIQGMRAAVDEAQGAFLNGDAKLRTQLLAPNNRKKMELMIGKKNADEMMEGLEQAKMHAEHKQAIVGGSDTIPKGGAVAALQPRPMERYDPDVTRPFSLLPPRFRDSLRPAAIIDALRGQTNEKSLNQLAGLLSTPEGQALARLLTGLQRETERRGVVNQAADVGENVLGSLIAMPATTTARRHVFPTERDRAK